MMANISRIRRMTSKTFFSAGIEANKVLTTSFSPSFLLMTLRGLRALKALKAFRLLRSSDVSFPSVDRVKTKSTKESTTIQKSRMFHPSIIYPLIPGIPFQKKPIAIIFMTASMMKMNVKIRSKYDKIVPNVELGSWSGLLNINVIELIVTITKMKFSNNHEIVIFLLVVIIFPLTILIIFSL